MPLDIAAKLIPAAGNGESGDFYVVNRRSDGSVLVVLGDVSGHGDAAHPHARTIRELIDLSAARARDPEELLEDLNAQMVAAQAPPSAFATAVAVLVGPRGGIRWASAGHPPPRWLDSGEALRPATPGPPLGVQATCGARTQTAARRALARGLLLHTDGLLDARGPKGITFGESRLTRAVRSLPSRRAGGALDALMRTVCHFASHALPDDAAAIVIRDA